MSVALGVVPGGKRLPAIEVKMAVEPGQGLQQAPGWVYLQPSSPLANSTSPLP